MKVVRNTRSKESRDFWEFVESTARKVESWPDWMKGRSTRSAEHPQRTEGKQPAAPIKRR
jgi:hypothetical protein